MNKTYFLILLATVVVGAAAAAHKFGAVNLDGLATENVGTLMLGAIFTALVIERAVEIVANNKFAAREFAANRSIHEKQQAVTIAEGALKHETELRLADATAPAAAALMTQKSAALSTLRSDLKSKRNDLNDAKTDARPDLEQIRHDKQSFAALLATALGALAAIAGVRVLEQFVEGDLSTLFTPESWQFYLFLFADIILTALLLAGGADGIHELTKDFYGKRKDVLASQSG